MRKALSVFGLLFAAAPLLAQPPAAPPPAGPVPKPASLGLFVYAQKNQDAAQQDKDEVECYRWAQQQTGLDPMAPTPAATPPAAQQGPDGSAVKGAARGAARGAIVGEAVNGDASDGARQAPPSAPSGASGKPRSRRRRPRGRGAADPGAVAADERYLQEGLVGVPRRPWLQRQVNNQDQSRPDEPHQEG